MLILVLWHQAAGCYAGFKILRGRKKSSGAWLEIWVM
jgi:hypothetical protein